MDFNKDFEKYLVCAYKKYAETAANSAREPEDFARDLYAEWADAPNAGLGGISPRAYFSAIGDARVMVEMFCETHGKNQAPCPLLLDRMEEAAGECREILKRQIAKSDPGKKEADNLSLLTEIVSFLSEHDIAPPIPDYVRILFDPASDAKLCDAIIEALAPFAAEAAPLLWEGAKNASARQKEYCAEILLHAEKDERTYALLLDLFTSGGNIPLYAGYLGKYGDERAAEILYKKLASCSYVEYTEIRNAIERMGGYVEDTRDFSDDESYKRIKDFSNHEQLK
ncbi:MAG: hypothetical protein FWD58_00020 [Firmicutes bacterium]|nr:hypothetical protein [Bacillota bacterium]